MGPEDEHGGHVDKDCRRNQGVCSHTRIIRHCAQNGNLPDLQRKSEDYYPESPGDTFSSGRFQIRTISLKYHVDYEVRVFEVAQVRRTLRYACGSQGLVIVILLVIFMISSKI